MFIFLPILIPALATATKYHEVTVRSDSFYSNHKVRTKSSNNCANICTAEVKKGMNYTAFVYKPEEQLCIPTNLAPSDTETAGLEASALTTAYQVDTDELGDDSYGKEIRHRRL